MYVSIAGNGASCHMTDNSANMNDVAPPPPGRESFMIGDGRRLMDNTFDSIYVVFDGYRNERRTLVDEFNAPGFSLLSLQAVQDSPCPATTMVHVCT